MVETRLQTRRKDGDASSQSTTSSEDDEIPDVRMEDLPEGIGQKIPRYGRKMRKALVYARKAVDSQEEAEKYTTKSQEYLAKSEHHQKVAQECKSKADEYSGRFHFLSVQPKNKEEDNAEPVVDASNEEGEGEALQTTKRMKLDTQRYTVKSKEFHEKYLQEHAMAQNFKLKSEDCLKKAAEAKDSARDFLIAAETLVVSRFD